MVPDHKEQCSSFACAWRPFCFLVSLRFRWYGWRTGRIVVWLWRSSWWTHFLEVPTKDGEGIALIYISHSLRIKWFKRANMNRLFLRLVLGGSAFQRYCCCHAGARIAFV